MKALICPALGPAETLRIEDVERPTAGKGEVLVDVAYAALNFFDTLIIEGKYQLKPEPPFSPAGEFAGRVAAVVVRERRTPSVESAMRKQYISAFPGNLCAQRPIPRCRASW